MNKQLATLLVIWLAVTAAVADPFEPDDNAPYLGAPMDGAVPDLLGPPSATIFDGFEPIWRITGRSLANSADRDWQIFYTDRYFYLPFAGRIRIYGTDGYSQANLRVEVLGYPRDVAINPFATPLVLQSCGAAPTGTAVIELGENDLRSIYRVRSCNSATNLNYEFEYRFTADGFGYAPTNVNGIVVDMRNGQASGGAYVYTNENSVTFSNPDDGEFRLAIISDNNDVILNFLAGDLVSIGEVNIGPVSFETTIDNVFLLGLPPDTIFASGFE